MASPGCNLVCWPCGEAVAGGLSLRIQQLDVRCETKTKDNVFVEIVVSVQYLVEREALYDAFYKLTDSRSQVREGVGWGQRPARPPRPAPSVVSWLWHRTRLPLLLPPALLSLRRGALPPLPPAPALYRSRATCLTRCGPRCRA